MVIETIIKPAWVAKQPLYALYLGITFALIGTSIGLFIFPEDASLAGILFTTIAATPFLQKVLDTAKGKQFWHRNGKIGLIYGLFFFGIAISYALWYFILPPVSSAFFFSKQIQVLQQPLSSIIGFFTQTQTGLIAIISNNLKLVIFALVLSFIYGVGATILITWNASVLGLFLASLGKFTTVLAFVPHASLEFIAFFFAAIAGGLLSIAVDDSKTKWKSAKFYQTVNDASLLFIVSVLVIVAAGFIETYAFLA